MERSIKGDYIGFTFGDVHSSELGLVRVSDGSRYNTDLLPPLEDKVAQVAGRDGEVLFGTNYKAKEIKVPVAFDNMTEENFRRLTQLLADKKPKSLWYDESPYKEWIVKSANVQDFKWVCFDESQNIARKNDGDPVSTKKRIYKGEGTLVFKCRSPYAQSRVTYLDETVPYVYVKEGYKIIKKEKIDDRPVTLQDNYNFEEWKEASGLQIKDYIKGNEDTINNQKKDDEPYQKFLYNVGDIDSDFILNFVTFNLSSVKTELKLIIKKQKLNEDNKWEDQEEEYGFLQVIFPKKFFSLGLKPHIQIDSKLKLLKLIQTNGIQVLNKYIKKGDFFKLPVCEKNERLVLFSNLMINNINYKHYYYV